MATITISYDARNKAVRSIVRMIEESGLFDIVREKNASSFERSLSDLKNGRVYEAKNGRDLIEQCLK